MRERILGAASLVGVALLLAAAPTGDPSGTGGQVGTYPASGAYLEAMEAMNRSMTGTMTGNPDQDYARMMIAHHQGAIDMALVELRYGTDPTLRAMAQQTIDDQTQEIEELTAWLMTSASTP